MKAPEALVCGSQARADFTQDHSHPTEGVPEVRVLRYRIELFDRHRLFKDKAGLPHDIAERPGGEHDDLVTARLQGTADAHEGVHVTGGADRG